MSTPSASFLPCALHQPAGWKPDGKGHVTSAQRCHIGGGGVIHWVRHRGYKCRHTWETRERSRIGTGSGTMGHIHDIQKLPMGSHGGLHPSSHKPPPGHPIPEPLDTSVRDFVLEPSLPDPSGVLGPSAPDTIYCLPFPPAQHPALKNYPQPSVPGKVRHSVALGTVWD